MKMKPVMIKIEERIGNNNWTHLINVNNIIRITTRWVTQYELKTVIVLIDGTEIASNMIVDEFIDKLVGIEIEQP